MSLPLSRVPPKAGGEHAPTRADPLDTPAELTARVDALWERWREIEDETRELVRIPTLKGAIRTALIRAQRDAAHRALSTCAALIEGMRRA